MKVSGVVAALRQPISARFRLRWSTVVMAILFVGLGSLWLEVKTSPSAASAANTSKAIDQVSRGLAPGESITITHNGTTSTTVFSTTTTVPPVLPVPTTSPAPSATTSTTHPPETATSPTTGVHHGQTTSTSVSGSGTTATTVSPETTTSSPG